MTFATVLPRLTCKTRPHGFDETEIVGITRRANSWCINLTASARLRIYLRRSAVRPECTRVLASGQVFGDLGTTCWPSLAHRNEAGMITLPMHYHRSM